MSNNTINNQSQVVLHYTLALDDGTIVDSTRDDQQPLAFSMEEDILVDGLKHALIGLKQGDKAVLTLTPEQGFGYRDTDNIHKMSRSDFAADMALEAGSVIGFELPSGDELPGMVLDLDDDEVTVDFNHPLAGHQITFDVDVVKVNND